MMAGNKFLREEFGDIEVKIGWQLDPFGHSNTNAKLYSDMGYEALFMARIGYNEKQARIYNKSLEFVWRPDEESEIFTHVFFDHYDSPSGLNFDTKSTKYKPILGPIEDETDRTNQVATFYRHLNTKEQNTTNNIMVLFGDDFFGENYIAAFMNLETLIEKFNKQHGLEYFLELSTPSRYLKKVKNF